MPPGILPNRVGAFPAAPSARALDATHRKKKPKHCVKRSLISMFGNHEFIWIARLQPIKSAGCVLQNRACRFRHTISSRTVKSVVTVDFLSEPWPDTILIRIHPATGVANFLRIIQIIRFDQFFKSIFSNFRKP